MCNEIENVVYDKSQSVLFNSYSRIGTEVLSNLHICRMEYEGKVFHSSEQLFYWLRLYGYPEYQECLMQCATPKESKRKGERFMKKLGIANDIRRDVQLLRLAIRVKYNCCEAFKNFLDGHPNIPIVEYAWWGDSEYGCVDIDGALKYNWHQGLIQGQNVCGRIIRGVRDEVKDENGKCIIARPTCLDAMKPLTLFS